MKLLIDAGNTRTKWGLLASPAVEALVGVETFNNADWLAQSPQQAVAKFVHAVQAASHIVISTVAGETWRQLFLALKPSAIITWLTSPAQALGLYNHYQHPAQLGSDRWCSMLAVWMQFHRHALVVNAGTALTIDAIQTRHNHQEADFIGGSIQPGLQLMWRSMQQGTAQLDCPLPHTQFTAPFAQNTAHAMLTGCLHALAGAVEKQYTHLAQRCDLPPILVLTGGDAAQLQLKLTEPLSAQAIIVDNLVLKGLAYLLESAHS